MRLIKNINESSVSVSKKWLSGCRSFPSNLTNADFLSHFFTHSLEAQKDSAQKAQRLYEKGLITEGAEILKRQIVENTYGFTRDLFLAKLYHDALAGKQLTVFETIYNSDDFESSYFKNLIDTEHNTLKAYFQNQLLTEGEGINLLGIDNKIIESISDTIISKYSGKVIYIDFWAPWCSPCMAEMSNSKELQKHFKGRNVVFLFLANRCSDDSWRATIANEKLTGEHINLTRDQYNVFAAKFEISSIPHYVLIDKEGNLAFKNAPRPGDNTTKDMISSLLK